MSEDGFGCSQPLAHDIWDILHVELLVPAGLIQQKVLLIVILHLPELWPPLSSLRTRQLANLASGYAGYPPAGHGHPRPWLPRLSGGPFPRALEPPQSACVGS